MFSFFLIIQHTDEMQIRVVNKTGLVTISGGKEYRMEQMSLVIQFLFWVGLGLWFLGVRFQYLEAIIGIIALVNGLLLVI
jgi:hypothetical protein